MVYRALRMQSLERYWPSVMIMTVQIVLGMIGLAIVLMVTIQVLIPLLPAE